MYKYYLIGDYFIGETSEKIDFLPIHKSYEDEEGIKIDNPNYNEEDSKEAVLVLVRQKRNELLKDTDLYMIEDYPLTAEQKTSIKDYRTQLRDFPQTITNSNFENIEMPIKPEL